jgi:hypothetical protein
MVRAPAATNTERLEKSPQLEIRGRANLKRWRLIKCLVIFTEKQGLSGVFCPSKEAEPEHLNSGFGFSPRHGWHRAD